MDERAECTHCRVLMTTWTAPGGTVRYWRCPLCSHTHSSAYGEVFRSGAGARLVAPQPASLAPPRLPQASADDIRWAALRARASRWFARLESEERLAPARAPARVRHQAQAKPRGRA